MKNGYKITTYEAIESLVKKYKNAGKKIVLTSGSFDMLHIGHCRYLCEAKKFGDILIVGIDSDKKIRKRKGPDRPVVPENERLEMLTYIEDVDHVIIKELNLPKWKLIKLIRPDVLIAIKETYNQEQLEKLAKYCGKVEILERKATTSTSAKIRLVQIGAEKRITKTISNRLIHTMEKILDELKE
ncbi:MAG: adenylyltransferase/cytidyltransferase family protein [Pseudomonadales bacterium]|nr:adenylyltransferase/cytidyltransferase family protein [Pseudomonadales bacterium]